MRLRDWPRFGGIRQEVFLTRVEGAPTADGGGSSARRQGRGPLELTFAGAPGVGGTTMTTSVVSVCFSGLHGRQGTRRWLIETFDGDVCDEEFRPEESVSGVRALHDDGRRGSMRHAVYSFRAPLDGANLRDRVFSCSSERGAES